MVAMGACSFLLGRRCLVVGGRELWLLLVMVVVGLWAMLGLVDRGQSQGFLTRGGQLVTIVGLTYNFLDSASAPLQHWYCQSQTV
jgi:hypothetical protein